jgi:beta-1,3-galactosyltransferase 1
MPVIYKYAPVVIPAENICQDGLHENQELFLLMMFFSAPNDFKQRRYTRERPASVTQWHGHEIRHVFLLAETDDVRTQRKIEQESKKYGDIVQFGFKDAFRNLTLKISAGLDWVTTYCPDARYVLKTDQDAAVFPRRIINFLEKLTRTEEKVLYNGGSMYTVVIRENTGVFAKYHISYKQYPYKDYPKYNRGLGYLMSRRIVKLFAKNTLRVPRVLSEDVYVGLLAKSLGIKPRVCRIAS